MTPEEYESEVVNKYVCEPKEKQCKTCEYYKETMILDEYGHGICFHVYVTTRSDMYCNKYKSLV